MLKRIWIFLVALPLLIACGGQQKRQEEESRAPDTMEIAGELEISEQAMEEIVHNVSSPIEMAALIKEIGAPFSTRYLAETKHVAHFNTNHAMAYNLGVYGADLGYLNIYEKTTAVVDYLTAINKLADGIRVGQFFDFPTLKRLAINSQNIDSLMYISVHSFNEMDSYLRETGRSKLSALIITGIWVEGMYLATQVAKTNPESYLTERIGEQKINLNNLLLILENYKNDPKVAELIADLQKIKKIFNDVKISYEMGEPEAVEQDGMLMIIQNETSIVDITPEQLKQITQQTQEIRNKHISLAS